MPARRLTRRRDLPACEPPARAARVDALRPAQVFAPILEDVDDGVAHLARRCERSRVVTVAESPSASPQGAIDRTSNTNAQPTRASGQCQLVARFDDEVDVVNLHRKMHDAKG